MVLLSGRGGSPLHLHNAQPRPVRAVQALDAQADPVRFSCTVEGVHDGDGPIYCGERDEDGRKIKIRLGGIAARELDESCRANQPCPVASGLEAKTELLRLATGHVLQCLRIGRSYARTVAYCSNGVVDLSCAMIRSGKALRWEKYDLERRLVGCAPAE